MFRRLAIATLASALPLLIAPTIAAADPGDCPTDQICLNQQTGPNPEPAAAAPPPAPPPQSGPPARQPSALPQPSVLLTPEQITAIQRAGHRLPGGPGPINALTIASLTPEQIIAIIATLPPEQLRQLLSLLTPEQAQALISLLPPGVVPVMPTTLPRTGGPPAWPALGLAGLAALGLGRYLRGRTPDGGR